MNHHSGAFCAAAHKPARRLHHFALAALPLAMVGALGLSLPANATPVSYTTSGIVQSGYDRIGLFGPAWGDLAGKRFVQTIRTDSNGFQPQLGPANHLYVTANGSGKVQVSVSIDGKVASWDIPHADATMALVNQLSTGINGGYDQLFLSLGGNDNIASDGSQLNTVNNMLGRATPFLPSLNLAQQSHFQPWAKDNDSYAMLMVNKDGQQTAFSGVLATASWNSVPPAAAVIQYIDSVNAVSGSTLDVAWAKWWGPSAQRWELLQNESVVCSGTLQLQANLDPQQEQHGACKVTLAGGDNRLVARLCQLEHCSDSAAAQVYAAPAVFTTGLPEWNAKTVYQQGAQVWYQYRLYQAKYWVQNTLPVDANAWLPLASTKFTAAQIRVADWKNDARAAYSIEFDDYCGWSNDAGQVLGEQELAKRQLVAGFGVMAGSCGDPAWSPHWPNLQAFVGRGHEVFNHSFDHGHPLDADWAYRKWGGNDLEIRASTELVAERLNGYRMQFFGFPFDVASDEQLAYLKARPQYLGTRTPNYWQANGINDKAFADPFRLRFQVYAKADQGSDNPAALSNFLRDTIAQQGFGLRVFHSVNDGYYESVPLNAYQQHLDEVKNAVDGGQLWVGNVSEVLKYRFAREHCAMRAPQPVALGLLLTFDNESAACRKYATPLTLVISNTATMFAASQGGRELPLRFVNDKILLQVDPAQGAVLLR